MVAAHVVIDELKRTGMLLSVRSIEGRGAKQDGRNDGGDLYFSDRMATIGVLKP